MLTREASIIKYNVKTAHNSDLEQIVVIDSIMGSGKTTFLTDQMNMSLANPDIDFGHGEPRFIYVTPLLTEVERIQASCPFLDFRTPKPVAGSKRTHLHELVSQGANIATTHSLFQSIDDDLASLVEDRGYVLVLDEALDCFGPYTKLKPSDQSILLDVGHINVDDGTGHLKWIDRPGQPYSGEFDVVRHLCRNENLVSSNGLLFWTFPTKFLMRFRRVFVLTYLFEGSLMSSHLRAGGLSYKRMTLSRGMLVPWNPEAVLEALAAIRPLVTICEGKLNSVGDGTGKDRPFSKSWLGRQSVESLQKLKKTMEYWFKDVAKTGSHLNAWTTFSDFESALKGARYTKGFIPCNAKATNDYRHKASLAYLCDRYHNPIVGQYFRANGVSVNQDLFALSELVQWIWRSQIRDGHPIKLFVPSRRMRTLLANWLSGEQISASNENMLQAA